MPAVGKRVLKWKKGTRVKVVQSPDFPVASGETRMDCYLTSSAVEVRLDTGHHVWFRLFNLEEE